MNKRIRILATSDVHGFIYPYLYSDGSDANIGFAKLHTLIESLRDEDTILIDNGDVLEGSPLSFYHFHEEKDQISPMTKVINEMGYDYVNLGNHDFNYGEEVLMKHIEGLNAPVITSNVLYHHKSVGPTYVIHEAAGKKIAIIGVVTQYIPHWERRENIRHLRFNDAFETLKRSVELVRSLEKPDYVVGVYHGGFERDLKNGYPTEELTGENKGYEMLKNIAGLDVLITGHQHRSLAGKLFNTVYTQTADKGAELACIDIRVDTNEIDARIFNVDTDSSLDIEAIALEEERRCQTWLDQPLGSSKVNLRIEDEFDARLHKSQLITFLNKVQMEKTGADLSGTALFMGAVGFGKEISMRDLVSTYVYPNTLVVKKITGATLRAYLEKCAEYWTITKEHIAVSPRYLAPKPQHYNYDMLDGIEYTITVSNDPGHRITSLTFNGEEVQDDQEFTLAINNYRAVGGGDFDMLRKAPVVQEIQEDMVSVLAEYIMAHQTIDFEPVNNIKIIR